MAMIIGVMNYKGGVGKTTTVVNLGTALWLMGYKVLLVDAEQQCSLTINMGFSNSGNDTLNEWMRGLTNEPPVYERYPGLDYIPSSDRMVEINDYLITLRTRNHVLYKLLQSIESYYDYILIDCAPNKGAMNDNVMVACDGLIIPTDCGDFAAVGLDNLRLDIEEINSDKYLNPDLKLIGVLRANHNERLNISKRIVDIVDKIFPGKLFNTIIHQYNKVNCAPAQFMSMFEYEPGCTVARDYMKLAEEITGKEAKGWFNKAKDAYKVFKEEYEKEHNVKL